MQQPGTQILWGQIALVLSLIVLSWWAATQWTAWELAFQPELGRPWFVLFHRWPVYAPCSERSTAANTAWLVVGSDVRLFLQADQVTGVGQLRTVSLPDGSTVTLAPRSAIAFTSDAHSRTVRLLQGEAWFDVRHSAEQPFHVVAHDLDVMDVGTKFDVQEAERETEVSVESGSVRVTSVNPPAISEDLVAGQTVAISADHLVRRGNADPTMIAGWRDGVLTVQNRTISDVVEAIRPWHRGLLILRGDRLGTRRVTGVYDLRHPQAAIKALADAYGIKITRISPWLVILSDS